METKRELWKQVKESIDKLQLDDVLKLDFSVDDNYPDTTDISINIEVKKGVIE